MRALGGYLAGLALAICVGGPVARADPPPSAWGQTPQPRNTVTPSQIIANQPTTTVAGIVYTCQPFDHGRCLGYWPLSGVTVETRTPDEVFIGGGTTDSAGAFSIVAPKQSTVVVRVTGPPGCTPQDTVQVGGEAVSGILLRVPCPQLNGH